MLFLFLSIYRVVLAVTTARCQSAKVNCTSTGSPALQCRVRTVWPQRTVSVRSTSAVSTACTVPAARSHCSRVTVARLRVFSPVRVPLSNPLSGSAGSTEENANPKGRVIALVIPVIMLIILCTIGMLYVGGFFGADTSGCTDYAGDFIGAFGNTDAFVGLPWGGIIALVLTVIYLVARRVVGFREAMGCIPKGFQAMISPIIILTLAVSLKTTLNALGAADYVHDLMYAASEGLYNMLPAVIFLVACVLAFASGTSWGTFGILIPIVTAIFPSDSALLYIGISACCAGAVCGDHCSPISDTTIMSSAGAQVEHVNHVATQLPYAITVACLSFVCFVFAGFIQNWIVCLAIGVVLTVGTLFAIRNVEAQKARIKD